MNTQDITVGTILHRVQILPDGTPFHNEYIVTDTFENTFTIQSIRVDEGKFRCSTYDFTHFRYSTDRQESINMFIAEQQAKIDALQKLISLAK